MSTTAFPARQAGLTLVELLVAAALSAVIVTAALSTMTSSQRLTDISVNQAGRIDELQALGALLGDDVRAATDILVSNGALTGLPATVPGAQVTQALLLTQPVSTACPAVNTVWYLVVPRSAVATAAGTTSTVNSWLQLPADPQNTDQRVLLRTWTCDTKVKTRLVADYLDSPEFAISLSGQNTFVTVPVAAVAGLGYNAVRLQVASRRKQRGTTIRIPATGSMTFIATSRLQN